MRDEAISVMIVDDTAHVRRMLRSMLEIDGFSVVGEAGSGEEAIARWRFGRDLVDWLNVLGYDWGPDGPPPTEEPAEDES